MTDTPKKVDTVANGKWVVDLSKWKTKQVRHWRNAAMDGNLDELISMAIAVVREWPYAGNPSEFDHWDELTPDESMAGFKQIGDKVSDFFR